MKTLLKIAEMMPYLPAAVKDAISHTAKESGQKVDDMELHRHSHSEKAKVNELDPTSRKSLAYVSARTQDRDDEIVLPQALDLKEFRKSPSVLVNHNYSLLPVGSDEWIDHDDYGIKALTVHADTGEGTLANVVWHLVSQGHLKGRSVGFVPTSFTKPGAKDWDHVTNQLQSSWKEFDKARAEKSISRIITGGVLLEHSFVSVPCNTDAAQICKSMGLGEVVIKQLGWEQMGKLVVPKGLGNLSSDDLRSRLNSLLPSGDDGMIASCPSGCYVNDVFDDHFIYSKGQDLFKQGYAVSGDKITLVGEPEKVQRRTTYVPTPEEKRFVRRITKQESVDCACDECEMERKCEPGVACIEKDCEGTMKPVEEMKKGFAACVVNKPNDKMPGGSFTACVAIMEGKGNDTESAKRICGALQTESGEKELTEKELKAVHEAKVVADKIDTDDLVESLRRKLISIQRRAEGDALDQADTLMDKLDDDPDEDELKGLKEQINALLDGMDEKKQTVREVKVVRPAQTVKVLYIPPDPVLIAKGVGEAVERALSRRTGRII